MKNKFLQAALILVLVFISMPVVPCTHAQEDLFGLEYGDRIGLGRQNPLDIMTGLLRVALGFVSLLEIVILILAGLQWMFSFGNDDRAASARKAIVNSLIGLVIIFSAWGLSSWAITSIARITGASEA